MNTQVFAAVSSPCANVDLRQLLFIICLRVDVATVRIEAKWRRCAIAPLLSEHDVQAAQ